MKVLRFVSIVVGVLVLYSCAARNIAIDYDPEASFENLKTYNWVPGTPVKTGNVKLDSDSLLHGRIKSQIENWLDSHGYKKADVKHADFLVTYYVTVEKKTEILSINDYYGYPGDWGYGYYGYSGVYNRFYAYEYDYGTLIIDIVNSKTRKLMWRGSIGQQVFDRESPEKKIARIAKAVDAVLRKFPPN